MKEQTNKERGITIVALIVTIITLLILAGITIATMFGDSSVIDLTEEGKIVTEINQLNEKIQSVKISYDQERIKDSNYTKEVSNDDLEENGIVKVIEVTNPEMKIGIINLNKLNIESTIGNNSANIDSSTIDNLTDLKDVFFTDMDTGEIYYINDKIYSVKGNIVSEQIKSDMQTSTEKPSITISPTTYNGQGNMSFTITANKSESNANLDANNEYQYYMSTSSTKLQGGEWKTYQSGETIEEVRSGSNIYYIFVKPIKDEQGNESEGNTIVNGIKYHKSGEYITTNQITLAINPNGGKYKGITDTTILFGVKGQTETIDNAEEKTGAIIEYNGNGGTTPSTQETKRNFRNWKLTGAGTFYNGIYTFGDKNATLTANYDEMTQQITLGTSERQGYTFKGWYTEAEGGEKVGDIGDTYTPTRDITLYAHWEKSTFTVEYHNGANIIGTSTHNVGVAKALTGISDFERNNTQEGFTFAGWTTTEQGLNIDYTDGQSVTDITEAGATLKLYAVWQREATFYSGKKQGPPIPDGFVASRIDGEQSVDDGFVIYQMTEDEANSTDWTTKDSTYNHLYEVQTQYDQFVWIPVEDINSMVMCKSHSESEQCDIKLSADGTYLYCANHNDSQDIVGKLYYNTSTFSFDKEYTAQTYQDSEFKEPASLVFDESYSVGDLTAEYKEMALSVAKHGGFYIGRYEVSLGDSETKEVAGQPSMTAAIDNQMWYGLYAKMKNYSSLSATNSSEATISSSSVKSSMIWGSQYDQMMLWMNNNGEIPTGAGYNDIRARITGGKSTDKINNIYDLIGNSIEWTLEANYDFNRSGRGGSYDNSIAPGTRYGDIPYNTNHYLTSRPSLYIVGKIAIGNAVTATQYYNPNGNKYSVTAPTVTDIEGYTTLGWRKDTQAEAKQYDSGATITDSSNEYYAVYNGTLSITYNGNGATGGTTANQSTTQIVNVSGAKEAKSLTVASNGFTRTNYNFTGWNTKSDGSGQTVEVGANVTESTTLYAQWTANTYTVTYNKNATEATGSMENGSATYNANFTPAANGFERTGYAFTGWNEKADGTGTAWTAGEAKKYETAGNITLYAQWGTNEYEVIFNDKFPDEYQQVEYIGATGNQYIDTGVKTSQNLEIICSFSTTTVGTTFFGGRTSYVANSLTFGFFGYKSSFVGFGGATTEYQTTINLIDGNIHTVDLSNSLYQIDGSDQTINNRNTLSLYNNIYLGTWNNNGEADTRMFKGNIYAFKIYDNSTGTMVRNLIPCYRKSDNVIGLYDMVSNTFFTNAGTGEFSKGANVQNDYTEVGKQQFEYGVTQNLTESALTKDGYTFAGWNTKPDGTGTDYEDKESVSNLTTEINGTVNLYAQWTANTYTIEYNLNGGTEGVANPTSYTIESETITLNNPTKEGYKFTGWIENNRNTKFKCNNSSWKYRK